MGKEEIGGRIWRKQKVAGARRKDELGSVNNLEEYEKTKGNRKDEEERRKRKGKMRKAGSKNEDWTVEVGKNIRSGILEERGCNRK